LWHTNASPVTLLDLLDWLSKHLNRSYLFLLLQIWKLNHITDFYLTLKTSTSQYGALTFDLEAVVYGKKKIFLASSCSVWDVNSSQNMVD